MKQLVRAKFLLTCQGLESEPIVISDAYLLFDYQQIVAVGQFSSQTVDQIKQRHGEFQRVICESLLSGQELHAVQQNKTKVPCHQAVLLPGFIKAHGHDHESCLIGVGRDVPLTTWLDESINLFTNFLEENEQRLFQELGCHPNYLCYLKSRMDDIYYGITSSMVHQCNYSKNHVEDLVRANQAVGTRITVAVGSQDRNFYEKILDRPFSVAVERLDRYVARYQDDPRVAIIPGPDQDFSNSPEMLQALKSWAQKHGSLIHIHSSEEFDTTQWFKKKYGQTPVEYLESIDFLDEQTIIAHQVHCSANDLEILRKRKVGVVHNPTANTILGSGMPPIKEMMTQGIRLAVATDGSGSSDNQNIIAAARLAAQYQKALHRDASLLPVGELFKLITCKPAAMLGYNAGMLEVGKDADFSLLDLQKPNLIPTNVHTLKENLFWAADGSEINTVVAGGKIIMQNKRYLHIDAADVYEKAQRLADQFATYKQHKKAPRGTGVHL